MRYRRFGKTNLFLSVFSLGTMRCLANQSTAFSTLQTALKLGVNHLETARGYGKSEEYLGKALKNGLQVPREQLYITTKLPPTGDPSLMSQWIDESLERLGIDYLDCLAIHGINTWEHLEILQDPNGCRKVIIQAMDEKKIRHLGFSTHGSLDLIRATINTGWFEFVNLHYYYFFRRNQAAIDLAKSKDMGVFIISPADKGGMLYTPPAKLQYLCKPFSPLELNYRFLLSDERITTLSVGPANPEELNLPLQVAHRTEELSIEERKVFQKLENELNLKLENDRCSQCYQCLPCPENINIPEILRLRNLAIAYDLKEYGKYRYGMFENAGHWFPGMKGNRCTHCGDCLPRCPEHLNIPELLFDAHQRLNGSPRRRLWEN